LAAGRKRIPRFTKEEIGASNEQKHSTLWGFILALDSSAKVHGGGKESGSTREGGNASQSGEALGYFRGMATRYGRYPGDVISETAEYRDSGVESDVYSREDGKVVKVKKLSVRDIDGVRDEFARIVYHNYLFPNDAYVLQE
jgi:hypothetical protein